MPGLRGHVRAQPADERGVRAVPLPAGARRHGQTAVHGFRRRPGSVSCAAARRGVAAAAVAPAAVADPGPVHPLGPARCYAEISGSTTTLVGLIGHADLSQPVPSCPDWTLRQLATHVGRRAPVGGGDRPHPVRASPSHSAACPTAGSRTTRASRPAGLRTARTCSSPSWARPAQARSGPWANSGLRASGPGGWRTRPRCTGPTRSWPPVRCRSSSRASPPTASTSGSP